MNYEFENVFSDLAKILERLYQFLRCVTRLNFTKTTYSCHYADNCRVAMAFSQEKQLLVISLVVR